MLQALREHLGAYQPTDYPALPGRTNHLRAGVLVPLIWGERPKALAIVRAKNLRQHANEVAFPGGKPEPDDLDLCQTALREAREELGIQRAEVLGQLSSIPLYTSDYRLVPYVALIEGAITPEPGEVAEVLEIDLSRLLETTHIDAIPWTWEGLQHLSPVFSFDTRVMFGGTAYVLLELLMIFARATQRELPPLQPGKLRWEDLFSGQYRGT